MKEKILILNACRWSDKETGELKAMMSIVFTNDESIADNKNFYGASPIIISLKVDNFDIIRPLAMQVVQAEIEFVNNARNPLKPKTTIKSLKTQDGKVFNLA